MLTVETVLAPLHKLIPAVCLSLLLANHQPGKINGAPGLASLLASANRMSSNIAPQYFCFHSCNFLENTLDIHFKYTQIFSANNLESHYTEKNQQKLNRDVKTKKAFRVSPLLIFYGQPDLKKFITVQKNKNCGFFLKSVKLCSLFVTHSV